MNNDHHQCFAFGRAAVALIDAVLREEIDELIDDFCRTLKGRIGQATSYGRGAPQGAAPANVQSLS
ncbi:hypothetical protein ABIB06_007116 [Bradyrhizobium sp. LB8.2]|uniref:hypothetical protein n=1 Tax=unclassified Bradyrhizobium TaxID=2631580 RepID=UPI003395321D